MGHNRASNPFTPDFGQTPAHLAGRGKTLTEIESHFAVGPRAPGFTTLLIGPRGTGKTALLNALVESCRSEGWVIVSVDAGKPGIHDRIGMVLDWLEHPDRTGLGTVQDRGRGRELTGAGFFGLSARWEIAAAPPRMDNRHRLAYLASQAGEHDTSVLLCVDEIHAGDQQEMRRLGDDIQHITKRESLPLAFLGAGLGDIHRGLLSGTKMTFFHRCHRLEVGLLTPAQAVNGVRCTLRAAGADAGARELAPILDRGDITPFHMQVIGSHLWDLSGLPDSPAGEWETAKSVELADAEMMNKVHRTAWYDLPVPCRRLLAELRQAGGAGVSTRDLKQSTGLAAAVMSHARRWLQFGGYILQPSPRQITLTGLMPGAAVERLAEEDEEVWAAGEDADETTNGRPADPMRCGKPMSRVPGRCTLRLGHAGGCRR